MFSLLPCEPAPFNGIDWRFLIRHRDLGPCARPQPGGQLLLSLTLSALSPLPPFSSLTRVSCPSPALNLFNCLNLKTVRTALFYDVFKICLLD